jgi:hypothetical protein
MVTALMVKPGEQPCVTQIHDDSDFLNCAVSIDANTMCTAAAITVERGIIAIYAWEGVFAGLHGNRKIGKRIIPGTFYIVSEMDGDLYSLTEADVEKYSHRFRIAKQFTDDEVINSWFDGLLLAM